MEQLSPGSLTSEWMAAYFQRRAAGRTADEAIAEACVLCPCMGKARAHIELVGLPLTVPVTGGAKGLKDSAADPLLSEHGKWRREHLGALKTVYGKAPYFDHLARLLEEVYRSSEGLALSGFARSLLAVAEKWCPPGLEIPTGIEEAAAETKALIFPRLSIFDALFRLGKRSSLGWSSTNTEWGKEESSDIQA